MSDCANKLSMFEDFLVLKRADLADKFSNGGLAIRLNNGDCELIISAAEHLYTSNDEKDLFACWKEFRIGYRRPA